MKLEFILVKMKYIILLLGLIVSSFASQVSYKNGEYTYELSESSMLDDDTMHSFRHFMDMMANDVEELSRTIYGWCSSVPVNKPVWCAPVEFSTSNSFTDSDEDFTITFSVSSEKNRMAQHYNNMACDDAVCEMKNYADIQVQGDKNCAGNIYSGNIDATYQGKDISYDFSGVVNTRLCPLQNYFSDGTLDVEMHINDNNDEDSDVNVEFTILSTYSGTTMRNYTRPLNVFRSGGSSKNLSFDEFIMFLLEI